jgi:DnaJ-domain-containing protein 1
MSIGRRLFNMARAELNSLLDRAAQAEHIRVDADPDEDLYRRYSLDQLTDVELEAEIERRQRARQAGARTSSPGPETPPKSGAGAAPHSSGPRGSGSSRARSTSADDELRRAYAALEVPFGADFATVRKSYRALMRKYHPDRHAGAPDKQKAATEVAQQLALAYKLIERRARK